MTREHRGREGGRGSRYYLNNAVLCSERSGSRTPGLSVALMWTLDRRRQQKLIVAGRGDPAQDSRVVLMVTHGETASFSLKFARFQEKNNAHFFI